MEHMLSVRPLRPVALHSAHTLLAAQDDLLATYNALIRIIGME
jgi:hypothetical protein